VNHPWDKNTRTRQLFCFILFFCITVISIFFITLHPQVSIPLQHIRGVYWSNFYHKTNGKAKMFMKIPLVGKCIGLAMMMRGLQEDKTDHW
jgi:hypothetical protein